MNLYRAKITDEGHISGPIEPLTAGPGITWVPSVSNDGRIALSRFYWVVHLWEVPLDTGTGEPVGPPRRITDDASPKYSFSLTRDGNRLAYSTHSGPRDARRNEIVLQDRQAGEEGVPLTLPAVTASQHPRLSPDGSLLSWQNQVDRQWVSWVAPIDEPAGRELCRDCTVVDFFSDGEHALVDWGNSLSRLRIADGTDSLILEMEEGRALLDTDLAPDDRWLAIQSGEPDGRVAIYAVPLGDAAKDPDKWIEIASGGTWAGAPRWSSNGNTLYYLSDRDDFLCVWGQALDPDTKVPVSAPFSVAHAHTSAIKMMGFAKHMWTLEVGGDRLVFNAGDMTGDVYTAMLEE
jgi:Tol biopolymer transport system component